MKRGSGVFPDRPTRDFQHKTAGKHMRKTGYVRRWCPDRGFGLIFNDDGSGEEFVHFSSLAATGLQALTPGMDVEFELAPRGARFHAVNVCVLDKAPE